MDADELLLRVRGLSVHFASCRQSVCALDGVSLEIHAGERVGILGESGAGKSTLGLSIMRLLPEWAQVQGQIEFRGIDLFGLPEEQLCLIRGQGIAFIHQEPERALHPMFRACDAVAEVLRAHRNWSARKCRTAALDILERVMPDGSSRECEAYPHQLSGGQRQRVALAQAIACSPALLIADEPTSALDAVSQAHLLQILSQLRRETAMATLFISHDPAVLALISDRILVMYKGRVIESGTVADLAGNPVHPYTRELLASVPKPLHAEVAAEATCVQGAAPREGPAPLIEVRRLTKEYRVRHLLRSNRFSIAVANVALSVPAGSTLAIVGQSGSGKSTLARAIAFQEEPSGGEIWVGGRKISGTAEARSRSLRQMIQLVPQDAGASLNPRFTALQVIEEPLRILGLGTRDERTNRANELLAAVHLRSDSSGRRVDEFSGGQRRRLAIARALATNPRIVLLDEALSGLDRLLQVRILALLSELQTARKLTYVFISHDLSLASQFASEIAVMYEGRIVDRAATQDLARVARHPHTRELIAAQPVWPARTEVPR